MTTDDRYEGWTNRETWAVALHINNDQGWQESVHEALRESHVHAEWTEVPPGSRQRTTCEHEAGEIIRENVEETLSLFLTESISLEILTDIGSIWRVNWTELGAAFLADLAEGDA